MTEKNFPLDEKNLREVIKKYYLRIIAKYKNFGKLTRNVYFLHLW